MYGYGYGGGCCSYGGYGYGGCGYGYGLHLCANRCFIHSVNHCRSCLFRWRLLLTTQHEIDQPYTAGHSFRCTFVKKSDIIYILSFRSEVS